LKLISQLSRQDKFELFKTLENELAYIKNGTQISLSDDDKEDLLKRNESVSEEMMCLVEFDDHVLYLKSLCNA